jgi:hypothetical protein
MPGSVFAYAPDHGDHLGIFEAEFFVAGLKSHGVVPILSLGVDPESPATAWQVGWSFACPAWVLCRCGHGCRFGCVCFLAHGAVGVEVCHGVVLFLGYATLLHIAKRAASSFAIYFQKNKNALSCGQQPKASK